MMARAAMPRRALLLAVLLATGLGIRTAAADPVQVAASMQGEAAKVTFAWPQPVRPGAKMQGDNLTLRFGRPVEADLAAIAAAVPGVVQSAEAADGGRTVVLKLKGAAAYKLSRDGKTIAVELTPRKVPTPAAEKLAAQKPADVPVFLVKTAAGAQVSLRMPAGLSHKLDSDAGRTMLQFDRPAHLHLAGKAKALPDGVEIVPGAAGGEALAIATPADKLKVERRAASLVVSLPAGLQKAAAASPTPAPAPSAPDLPPVSLPTMTPAAPDEAARAVAPAPPPKLLMQAVQVEEDDGRLRLRLPGTAMARLAAFERAGHVWIVLDRPVALDLRALDQYPDRSLLTRAELRPSGHATVIRIDVATGVRPIAVSKEGGWALELATSGRVPRAASLHAEAGPPPRLVVDAPDASEPVEITDPEVGDRLLVLPLATVGIGIEQPQDLPELLLLATGQGVAVVARSDAVKARVTPETVEISTSRGLLLSTVARQPRRRIGTVDSGGKLFDFYAWAPPGQDYADGRRALSQALADAGPDERLAARLKLARFYFAQGHAAEARGALDVIAEDAPDAIDTAEFRALRGATALALGRMDEAEVDLTHPVLEGEQDATLWRGVLSATRGEWPAAEPRLQRGVQTLKGYPAWAQRLLFPIAIDAALRAGKPTVADSWLNAADRTVSAEPVFQVLRGRVLAALGSDEQALALFKRAAGSNDRHARVDAELARVAMLRDRDRMTPAKAIESLDRLRFLWRGDRTERDVLDSLGRAYLDAGDYWNGLQTLRQGIDACADFADVSGMKERLNAGFRRLFIEGEATKLPPVKAVALYEEFRELTPAGEEGDKILRSLAGRLIALDLLDQAAQLLEHQMRYRLAGAAKADVGADLALVRLLDRKPDAALAALRASAPTQPIPPTLADKRRRLEARALADTGKLDEAVATLAPDASRDAEALRADIAWRRRAWPAAAAALAKLAPPEAENLDPAGATSVVKLAAALAVVGDGAALGTLNRRYGAAMAKSAHAATFRLLTAPNSEPGQTSAAIAGAVAGIDEFQRFLKGYREELEKARPTT